MTTPNGEIGVVQPPEQRGVAVQRAGPGLAPAHAQGAVPAYTIPPEREYAALMALGKDLVSTGFLPRSVNTPAKAVAIILTGREMGLPPMLSLRLIHIIEGRPTLAAELMLGQFQRRGGMFKWLASDNYTARLWLRHPNGAEHEEEFTLDDAKMANLVAGWTRDPETKRVTAVNSTKDNWRKYPKSMLRARCASAGLRAIAPEMTMGVYDPDELGAETDEHGNIVAFPVAAPDHAPAPGTETADEGPAASSTAADEDLRESGKVFPWTMPDYCSMQPWDARWPSDGTHGPADKPKEHKAGDYIISETLLRRVSDHCTSSIKKVGEQDPRAATFFRVRKGAEDELLRRADERADEEAARAKQSMSPEAEAYSTAAVAETGVGRDVPDADEDDVPPEDDASPETSPETSSVARGSRVPDEPEGEKGKGSPPTSTKGTRSRAASKKGRPPVDDVPF